MSNFYIAPSSIHGKGIHASRNFKVGEDIGYVARAVSKSAIGKEYFQTNLSSKLETKIERSELEKYLNHTNEPNARCKSIGSEIRLIAIKPIKKDEEIVVDYDDAYKELDKSQIIVSINQ